MSTPEHPPTPEPGTSEHWRELLRRDEQPDEIAELPLRQRRRARKHWRSARRDERAQWIRAQRANPPTGLHIPAVAILLAAVIGLSTWLWPQHHGNARPQAQQPSPVATQAQPAGQPSAGTPTAAASASPDTAAMSPQQIAVAFMTGYCTRIPLQDASQAGAVARAAPYASSALVDNLTHFDDHDFDVLVSRQVSEAHPGDVTAIAPTEEQRPGPDTQLRVYLQATTTVSATATVSYTYQRSLTLEISRADVGDPWMVTRIIGLPL